MIYVTNMEFGGNSMFFIVKAHVLLPIFQRFKIYIDLCIHICEDLELINVCCNNPNMCSVPFM